MPKKRIDIYLFENGFVESRMQAQKMIMAGSVLVNDVPVTKSSQTITDDDIIRIKEKLQYVSRGAFKLEKALEDFNIDVASKTFIDFGSSTGGFTDVLLQKGAKKVTCVDVGYGQLAWKIRNDERVNVLERTNARYLTPDLLNEKADGAVCDVSFISVKKIIPAMQICTKDDAFIIILIKPQFEAGKNLVGKKGIIKDKKIHLDVVCDIVRFIKDETAFNPTNIDYSPIKGQKGNIEYLLLASKLNDSKINNEDIIVIVNSANAQL